MRNHWYREGTNWGAFPESTCIGIQAYAGAAAERAREEALDAIQGIEIQGGCWPSTSTAIAMRDAAVAAVSALASAPTTAGG